MLLLCALGAGALESFVLQPIESAIRQALLAGHTAEVAWYLLRVIARLAQHVGAPYSETESALRRAWLDVAEHGPAVGDA